MPKRNTYMEFRIFYKTLVTNNETINVYSYFINNYYINLTH